MKTNVFIKFLHGGVGGVVAVVVPGKWGLGMAGCMMEKKKGGKGPFDGGPQARQDIACIRIRDRHLPYIQSRTYYPFPDIHF